MPVTLIYLLASVYFSLTSGSAQVSLHVEEGVSLVGPHCPGTVRLFCEGVDLTLLTWLYNGRFMIGDRFTPDDTITTRADSNPAFVSVQLTKVSQSSNPIFGNFSSILTVNVSILEQQNIVNISCGDIITRSTISVDLNYNSLEALPQQPQLIKVNKIDNFIIVVWKKPVSSLFSILRLMYL